MPSKKKVSVQEKVEKIAEEARKKISDNWMMNPYWLEKKEHILQPTITQMEKTSKVQAIGDVNQWDWPKGTIYYHTLEMENGETISLGKTKENAFSVGEEVTYEEYTKSNGKKWYKHVTDSQKQYGGKSYSNSRNYRAESVSYSMSYAKDIFIAKIQAWEELDLNDLKNHFEGIFNAMQEKYQEIEA